MNIVEKYTYSKLERNTQPNGYREYITPDGESLTSVTTILDQTKPEEAKKALENWRKGVGIKKSTSVTEEAAFRGTLMHKFLEETIKGLDPKPGTNIHHKQSSKMAKVILETYLTPNLSEVWGLETSLYYPGLYAGTTDLVGIYNGQPSIMDFKQSNKYKTDDRVIDYRMQLVAYAQAHNKIYGTNIRQGVILMCTVELEPQTWIIQGDDFDYWSERWWERVKQFYKV
jgi:ATP-dependent exoDNAse (exonuclease V) beta subunit